MKIKKSQLALGLTTLAIIGAVGISSSVLAANTTNTNNGLGLSRGNGQGLALTEEQKAEREARRSEMETKLSAVNTALEAGDYNAWVAAVGADCPMLEKINDYNFNRYVEAYKLRQQEQKIMEELGLNGGDIHAGLGMGNGMGRGLKMGHGFNK